MDNVLGKDYETVVAIKTTTATSPRDWSSMYSSINFKVKTVIFRNAHREIKFKKSESNINITN